MRRDLTALAAHRFDVIVVGGGIYGAFIAWEAAVRGLSVALLEQADFASAASANSLKIIHGGLRYLQQADLKRMRESHRERTTLMRIAPQLVHPLPVLIPAYGHGMTGREMMALALKINDAVSFDRNRLLDPEKHIPNGKTLSRAEVLRRLPELDPEGVIGGHLFYDAQVYNSERLILGVLQSAAKAGAHMANYAAVTGLLRRDQTVTGVTVCDQLTGDTFDVQGQMVINAAGAWVASLLREVPDQPPRRFAKAINLITRRLFNSYAVGIPERDTNGNRRKRLLFAAPWRGYTLIGTAYRPYSGSPDSFRVTDQDIRDFLAEVNRALPNSHLTMADVLHVHGGLLPQSLSAPANDVRLERHYTLIDHRHDGISGLITVLGVKYTTARDVAAKTIDAVFRAWGQFAPPSRSATIPIEGGQIYDFAAYLSGEVRRWSGQIAAEDVRRLVYTYGAVYETVLKTLRTTLTHLTADDVLRAEILYGIREEMAQTLSDIVLRRTEICSAGDPGFDRLKFCADVMATELAWNPVRQKQEMANARSQWIRSAAQAYDDAQLVT